LSFIGATSPAVFWETGSQPLNFNFGIASGGENVIFSQNDTNGTVIDAVEFGGFYSTQSQGRLPNGTGTTALMLPTPGRSNAAGNGPVFLTHPQSATIRAGQPYTLSATVQSASTLQWRINGSDLNGEETAEILLPAPTFADSGSYTLLAEAETVTLESLPAQIQVVSTYTNWAAENAVGAAEQDADGDGLTNGIEFLFGTSPTVSSPSTLVTSFTEIGGIPTLSVEFTRSGYAALIDLRGELSSDLTVWTPTVPTTQTVLSTSANGDERLRWSFTLPAGNQRKFLRLQLSAL
jgi:hypothetical protein